MNQQQIADRSAELIMRYYDNDYMPFLESMDDDALWYGPAEGQFLRGRETMIRVWVHFASYNPRQNLRNWIYTIAIRLCFDRLKSKAPIEPLPEDEDYFSQYVSDSDTEKELENHELLSVIKTLVSRLSPRQRIVFTLVHLENLDTEEVAQITGLDAARIKSNLYVARKTIREQLKQFGYGKDG